MSLFIGRVPTLTGTETSSRSVSINGLNIQVESQKGPRGRRIELEVNTEITRRVRVVSRQLGEG